MNLNANYNTPFCANAKTFGISVRIAPQITRLTAIADLEIGQNRAVAYTSSGKILSTNYNNIMTSLREAVTELTWTHKYNSAKGTWTRK